MGVLGYTLRIDDGDMTVACSLSQFLAANPGLDDQEVIGLWRLNVGQSYTGGGGAAAEWTVTRVA